MEETAHTHAKTRQSLACKCDFSLRLVCFAFEFTKQLAAMRNEKTQDETGKKKMEGKGKDGHPDGAKEAEDRFQETKKKQNRDSRIQSRRFLCPHAQSGNKQTIKQAVHEPASLYVAVMEDGIDAEGEDSVAALKQRPVSFVFVFLFFFLFFLLLFVFLLFITSIHISADQQPKVLFYSDGSGFAQLAFFYYYFFKGKKRKRGRKSNTRVLQGRTKKRRG